MKNYLLIPIIMAGLVSCTDKPDPAEIDATTQENVFKPQYLLTEDFQVPVTPGNITVVTRGTETLAITDVPMTIQIPKSTPTRAEGSPSITNIPYAEMNWFVPGKGIKFGTYMLVFEDSPVSYYPDKETQKDKLTGDCDYNDFVVIVHQKQTKSLTNPENQEIELTFRPIALGSTKDIEFGYELCLNGKIQANTERILYSDVRTELFKESEGSGIKNTYPKMEFKRYIADGTFKDGIDSKYNINYFIRVDNKDGKGGKKLSVASVTLTNTGSTLPYGLAIPPIIKNKKETPFLYPNESKSIFDAYNKFGTWLKGENSSQGWYKNVAPQDENEERESGLLVYRKLEKETGLFEW